MSNPTLCQPFSEMRLSPPSHPSTPPSSWSVLNRSVTIHSESIRTTSPTPARADRRPKADTPTVWSRLFSPLLCGFPRRHKDDPIDDDEKKKASVTGLSESDIATLTPSIAPSKTKPVTGKTKFRSLSKRSLSSILRPPTRTIAPIDPRSQQAYEKFLAAYPAYSQTFSLDELRRSPHGFGRLHDIGETYVDYAGGSLYPASLVHVHAAFLENNVLGNTHSVSNTSQLSARHASAARAAVLHFFDAPPGYTVVFTANASAALKLVGEAFPFQSPASLSDDIPSSDQAHERSVFILPEDAHNSVHGIRVFAASKGANVHYLPIGNHGGVDITKTKAVLEEHCPSAHCSSGPLSLVALTGQSNITNAKTPLSLLAYAASLGYRTLLDAAALAPSSRISLSSNPGIDAMVVSFYKMFGYPTGVGALVVKESFLNELSARRERCGGPCPCSNPDINARAAAPQSTGRPWFAGGTVDIVQVPGSLVTMAVNPYERFEDGTINYLSLPAITLGLAMLSPYLEHLPTRLASLTHYLATELEALRYPRSGRPFARVLSRVPKLLSGSSPNSNDDIESDEGTGGTLSLVFLMPFDPSIQLSDHSPSHNLIPNSFISEFSASAKHRISLRTGCMCNPGGAAYLLGIQHVMEALSQFELQHDGAPVTLDQFEAVMGRELGVVRISLGWGSDWGDIWRVLEFARDLADEVEGEGDAWFSWMKSCSPQ